MSVLLKDLRHGMRQLFRRPAFAAAAIGSLSLGFDPGPVSSLSFNLQMNGYDLDRATTLRDRALQALAALPRVTAVSTATRLPLAPDINIDGVTVPGHHGPDDEGTPVDTVSVGSDYFRVVGVPITAGRAFTTDDIVRDAKSRLSTNRWRSNSGPMAPRSVGRSQSALGRSRSSGLRAITRYAQWARPHGPTCISLLANRAR